MTEPHSAGDTPFRLEEATIDQLHMAIRAGRTTCVAIVQHYIERARAYNGVATFRRKSSMWRWPVYVACGTENCTTALT
jgi:hypothetical protein